MLIFKNRSIRFPRIDRHRRTTSHSVLNFLQLVNDYLDLEAGVVLHAPWRIHSKCWSTDHHPSFPHHINHWSLTKPVFLLYPPNPQIYPDPESEKAIMGSLVFCIHHKQGCKWSDELRKLKVIIPPHNTPIFGRDHPPQQRETEGNRLRSVL